MDLEVNKDNYEEVVINAGTPTVVDFWGPQCRHCFALMPAMERLAEEHEERMRLIKVDASKNRRLCVNLRLRGLPTFLFYRDGKEKARLAGNQVTEGDLRKAVAELLSGEEGTP
jgi:thioredoxin 1